MSTLFTRVHCSKTIKLSGLFECQQFRQFDVRSHQIEYFVYQFIISVAVICIIHTKGCLLMSAWLLKIPARLNALCAHKRVQITGERPTGQIIHLCKCQPKWSDAFITLLIIVNKGRIVTGSYQLALRYDLFFYHYLNEKKKGMPLGTILVCKRVNVT